jgi:hypothetical protein
VRQLACGAVALPEEVAQTGETGILDGLLAMLGGHWLCGIRVGSGYRPCNYAGENSQTIRKQLSHIRNFLVSEIWF